MQVSYFKYFFLLNCNISNNLIFTLHYTNYIPFILFLFVFFGLGFPNPSLVFLHYNLLSTIYKYLHYILYIHIYMSM